MYHLLIAEDEPLIRKGICNALNWEEMGFSVCAAVENGLEVLTELSRNRVDVLLTDIKMPGMDGLETIRRIRREYPTMEIVVLSGYSDFAYVQEALRHHVFDYVLKMDILTELEPVMRRLRKKMDDARKAEASESLRTLFERLDASALKDCAELSRFVFAQCPAHARGILEHQQYIETEPDGYAVLLHGENLNVLNMVSQKFSGEIISAGGSVILGDPFFQKEEAAAACSDLIKARDFLVRHPEQNASLIRTEEIRYVQEDIGVFVQARKFAQRIQGAPLEEQLAGLSAMMAHFADTEGATAAHARLCAIYALSQIACIYPEGSGKLYAEMLQKLNHAINLRSIETILADFLRQSAQLPARAHPESTVVDRAIRYINHNFCKNLKQETVAARFYISTSYFSRCFKRQVGMGFTDYIRKLRMEWARHLLEETNMRVQDIALECGYGDIKHFNQTFRGYYGMSASEMRNRKNREQNLPH